VQDVFPISLERRMSRTGEEDGHLIGKSHVLLSLTSYEATGELYSTRGQLSYLYASPLLAGKLTDAFLEQLSAPLLPPPTSVFFPAKRPFHSLFTPKTRPTTPSSHSAVLTLLRTHASYSRSADSPSSPPKPPPRTPAEAKQREHELSEAAGKATQAHSGPEGHQKEPTVLHNSAGATDVSKTNDVSEKEQSRRDWDIIRKLLPNVWPKNDWSTKTRVLLALALLVGGKVRCLFPLSFPLSSPYSL
jgi:hypothetical protein